MKRFGPLVFCLMAGCIAVTHQPVANGPFHLNLPKRAIVASETNYVVPRWTNAISWVYPPGASNNYCWTLQGSSNLVDWVDLPDACVSDPLYGFATNTAGYWRLKGSP